MQKHHENELECFQESEKKVGNLPKTLAIAGTEPYIKYIGN
jgi:hypothetical protein